MLNIDSSKKQELSLTKQHVADHTVTTASQVAEGKGRKRKHLGPTNNSVGTFEMN